MSCKFTHCARHILCVSMYWKNILVPWPMLPLASSPGQIISRSCGEKPWEHCYVVHRTESTVSGPWRSNVPRPSPDFSPRLRDKIWEWPGDEAMLTQVHPVLSCRLLNTKISRKEACHQPTLVGKSYSYYTYFIMLCFQVQHLHAICMLVQLFTLHFRPAFLSSCSEES